MLLGCFLFAAAIPIGWVILTSNAESRTDNLILGEVTMRGHSIDRLNGNPMVQVVLPDGTLHNLAIKQVQVADCPVGATIELQDFLGKLRVSPRACSVAQDLIK